MESNRKYKFAIERRQSKKRFPVSLGGAYSGISI
jgi:hypothetical protein